MAKPRARRSRPRTRAGRTRRPPGPTLPQLFQRYFDRNLRVHSQARIFCCVNLARIRFISPLSRELGEIATTHFSVNPEQARELAGWPEDQLRLFAATLEIGLRCPPGVPPPGPEPGPIPGRPPLPDPPPSYRMRFRGRARPGVRRLEVAFSGRTIEITFVAPRIP
jgi:hypothetical protein